MEWRALLLDQGVARAGRALARPLQHCQTALVAGLQTAGACSVADRSAPGAWKSGKKRTLPTFQHPRLLRRVISITRRATLTLCWYKTSGWPIRQAEQKSATLKGQIPCEYQSKVRLGGPRRMRSRLAYR